MGWHEQLEQAERALGQGKSVEAFETAFGALEACYSIAAGHRGWTAATVHSETFMDTARFLRESRDISEEQFSLAAHLAAARNVVVHKYGFEPSIKETERTVQRVRQLCARFGETVAGVMIKPVRVVRPDQMVGELIHLMIHDGISQFPVVEAGKVVGTLSEDHVFEALEKGDGVLDPKTLVRDVMDPRPMPTIAAEATLAEAQQHLDSKKVHALLVLQHGAMAGILTKRDLLHHLAL